MSYLMKTGSYHVRFPLWIPVAAVAFILVRLAGYNGLYGQDPFEYLRFTRALHEYLCGGAWPGPFHWPVLYPFLGAILSFIMPVETALQVVSVTCYALTFLFLQKTLRFLYPERGSGTDLYLILFFALSPFVLRYSSSVLSDATAMFFIAAFFYCCLRYFDGRDKRFLALLVFCASAAVNTRYACAFAVIAPLAIITARYLREISLPWFLVMLLAALIPFIPVVVLFSGGNPPFQGQEILPSWSPLNLFRHSFSGIDGHLAYAIPNILFALSNLVHPGFIFMGVAFIFLLRRRAVKREFFFSAFVSVLLYWIFIAGFPVQNMRFLLLAFPLVVIFYAGPYFRITDLINKNTRPVILAALVTGVVTVQGILTWHAFQPFYKDSVTTREIASCIKRSPGKLIYTLNMDMGLKAYGIGNRIINLWVTRVDHFETGAWVLFNYPAFSSQWKGMNPMLNWESLIKSHSLKPVEYFPGNWVLYEIEN